MTRNLGQCSLRRKRRSVDPLDIFDGLPTPLRQWLSEAALPWSPSSAKRVWSRALARGLTPDEALAHMTRAEAQTLAREKYRLPSPSPKDTAWDQKP